MNANGILTDPTKAAAAAAGLGACPPASGGFCNVGPGATAMQFCAAGSPKLGLAKALGIPFAPYIIPMKAVFPDAATTLVPDVKSDVKIYQDTYIDAMVIRVMNEGTPNLNQFSTLSDFFFNYQSGIQMKLDVLGAPRYSIVPQFTDISVVADMIGGGHWPCGWILTVNQQLQGQFQTTVALPSPPVSVRIAFRGWLPIWDATVTMSTDEAVRRLKDECGIDCGPGYNAHYGCR